ncbi:MAG: chromosomal replication initiator protein DnaA, partial [Muribaculaceae bacterium]|nr:chromosomal replication initiator protein DnaA [Muribaculaceae bacterium]
IREIVGVVASLMGRAMVLGCDVNLDLARKVVSNVVKINEHRLDFELIVDRVANYYGIESDKLFTKTRKREISDMRQVVMYLAKAMANMSLKAIGSRLGRSHATVLYGCNTIEQRLGVDRKLTEEIKSIEAELKAV